MNSFNSSDVSSLFKCEKTVPKRRSSIFQSRTIVFNEDEENEKPLDTNEETDCVVKTSEEKVFNLEDYVRSLKNERKEWMEVLKRRKAERNSLVKKKARLENQGQPLDLNTLSDSGKAFVTASLNYQQICESNRQLSEMALKVSILNRLTYKLNKRFILEMEKKLGEITEKVIQISEL